MMRLDFGVDTIDIAGPGKPEKVELLGMRGRKHALQQEPWEDFRRHLKDLRGMPTHWSVDEAKQQIRVWPVPNMAMHIEVTMRSEAPPEPIVTPTEPEILPPAPKIIPPVRVVRERRA